MRTTNAFGTSWTSRHGSPQTRDRGARGVRGARVGLVACSAARTCASRARRSRPPCRARRSSRWRPRPSSGSSPRRRRTARARTSSSAPASASGSVPTIAAASAPRAATRHHEHVAAGDAVDVGDAGRDGGRRGSPSSGLSARRRSTSPGVISPGANISRTPQTASDVGLAELDEAPRRRSSAPPSPLRSPGPRGGRRCGRAGRGARHVVGVERHAVVGARVEPQDVARAAARAPRSIGSSTAATSARTVTSTPATALARPRRPGRRRRSATSSRGENAVATRRRSRPTARAARASRSRASMRASNVSVSVGSLTGAICTLSRCVSRPASAELDAGEVLPHERQLCDQAVEEVARERPVDLGQLRSPAAALGGAGAAEQQLDRAQHEGQLGGQQHARRAASATSARRRPSLPAPRVRVGPRQLGR